MSIVRRILLIAIAVMLASGILYLAYLLYQSLQTPARDPVQAIPDRTALIIRINRPLELLEELTRTNLIWKELLKYPGVKPIQEQLLLIDSMSRGNPKIREILKKSPLTVTLSVHGRASFDPLFLVPLPKSIDGTILKAFIEEHYPGKVTVLQSPYNRTQIYRIHFENKPGVLSITVWEGVGIFSFADDLVKRAIDQLSLNTPVSVMQGFSTVASTTGKKVDANLYINFPYLSLALWKGVTEMHNKGLVKFARYADWSGLDLYIKKDELVLSGYTIASDSAMQTLALMGNQSPLPLTMTNLFPASTQSYLIYALIDYPDYFRRWQFRLQCALFSTEEIDLFRELDQQYDTCIGLFLNPWVGQQAGRCWIQPSSRDPALFPVTIIQTADPDSARKSLLALSLILGKKTDSIRYEGVSIYRTGISEPLNMWLNPLFEPVDMNCFTLIGKFVCLASHPDVLKRFLERTIRQEYLTERPDYRAISDNLSDRANFSFYSTSNSLLEHLPEALTGEYIPLFLPLLDSLKKFRSVTAQLSAEDGMFYTNLQLHFNPKTTQEGPLVWQTTLDTLVSGAPQIIRSGRLPGFAVLVTDTLNTLYKIDRRGQIMWKQKLYGRVLGTYHQVMLTGNDSLFYLFNTENHLYLIRSDGRLADRFPMKFPVRASNGLSVVTPRVTTDVSEYSEGASAQGSGIPPGDVTCTGSPDQFQVVLAFRNNRIYSFDLNGQLSGGWSSPEVEEEVVVPVRVLEVEGAHYQAGTQEAGSSLHPGTRTRDDDDANVTLFVTMRSGRVLVTDGYGVRKVTPVKAFTNSPHSTFYLNRTNAKGPWLTTDPAGDVVYLQENGHVERTSFNTFTSGHYFFYEDIMDDGYPEFIFFDNNTLYYYNRFSNLAYFYSFRHDVSPPAVVKTLNGKILIGIISPPTNEVFLFDRHGYAEIESGIKGTTPFDIGTLEDVNRLNLVIGAGKVVKGFRLMRF